MVYVVLVCDLFLRCSGQWSLKVHIVFVENSKTRKLNRLTGHPGVPYKGRNYTEKKMEQSQHKTAYIDSTVILLDQIAVRTFFRRFLISAPDVEGLWTWKYVNGMV